MKTKLIIFDFDGTLSKPSKLPNSWARVWNKIGREKDDEILYGKYCKGEFDYNQWAKEVIKVYRDAGVSKNLLKEISKDTSLLDNAEEVFRFLYENDIKIIILSGGIKNIIDEVLGECKKYIYKIEAQELLFDENGKLFDITVLEHHIEDKSQYVDIVMKNLRLNPNQVLFFGNGKNDEDVYKTGIKTICINPDDAHFDNKLFWNETIKHTDDLKSILSFIK